MKTFLFILVTFVTYSTFGQGFGSVVGTLGDAEENNAPLVYAHVKIKETGVTTQSDLSGVFQFELLNEGTYTLQLSFAGYESKELKINVASNKITEIKSSLGASSISFADLIALESTASREEKENSTEDN